MASPDGRYKSDVGLPIHFKSCVSVCYLTWSLGGQTLKVTRDVLNFKMQGEKWLHFSFSLTSNYHILNACCPYLKEIWRTNKRAILKTVNGNKYAASLGDEVFVKNAEILTFQTHLFMNHIANSNNISRAPNHLGSTLSTSFPSLFFLNMQIVLVNVTPATLNVT